MGAFVCVLPFSRPWIVTQKSGNKIQPEPNLASHFFDALAGKTDQRAAADWTYAAKEW
jgi:hypothetical protein